MACLCGKALNGGQQRVRCVSVGSEGGWTRQSHRQPASPGGEHRLGIVVGIDGSEGSKAALSWAIEEARLRRTPLTALTAWSIPPIAVAYGLASAIDEEFLESVRTAASGLLDDVLAGFDQEAQGVELHAMVAEGPAVEVLVEASSDAELLVVGSRGLGGFKELLLGSVSHQCAQHAHCPIVIVRQEA